MCGIVAVSPAANIVPVLLKGLRKLECRDYDSAGIAVLNGAGEQRVRTAGRVAELAAANEGVAAHAGIAHTRRATHGAPSARPVVVSQLSADAVELGQYRHYMQKEIFEQPEALANTLELIGNGRRLQPGMFGADAASLLGGVRSVLILACGTSYHSGVTARYWFESLAGIPCTVEIANRYLSSVTDPDQLVVAVAPNDSLLDRLKSNLQEVQAHDGELYAFADADSHFPETEQINVLRLPEHYGDLSLILHVVPLQLLAFHTALAKGAYVDKPRNLAKSVTVE